jgi:hypothetical protein
MSLTIWPSSLNWTIYTPLPGFHFRRIESAWLGSRYFHNIQKSGILAKQHQYTHIEEKDSLHRNRQFSRNEKKYALQHPHYHNYHGTTPTIYTSFHPSDTRNYRRDTMICRISHPCRHHRETPSVDFVDVDNRCSRCLRLYHGWGLYSVPLNRQLWR